jgi:hypothetical protein
MVFNENSGLIGTFRANKGAFSNAHEDLPCDPVAPRT